MKPRQWPWYVFQLAVMAAVLIWFQIVAPGEFGFAPAAVAFGAAWLATRIVALFIPNKRLPAHVDQPSGEHRSVTGVGRHLGYTPQDRASVRIGDDPRNLIEVLPKLPTPPRITDGR